MLGSRSSVLYPISLQVYCDTVLLFSVKIIFWCIHFNASGYEIQVSLPLCSDSPAADVLNVPTGRKSKQPCKPHSHASRKEAYLAQSEEILQLVA